MDTLCLSNLPLWEKGFPNQPSLRWLKACISLCYQSSGSQVPGDITTHSTRGVAASAVFSTEPSGRNLQDDYMEATLLLYQALPHGLLCLS